MEGSGKGLFLSAVSRDSGTRKATGIYHRNTSSQNKHMLEVGYLTLVKITSYCDFTRKQSRQNIQNMIFHIVL